MLTSNNIPSLFDLCVDFLSKVDIPRDQLLNVYSYINNICSKDIQRLKNHLLKQIEQYYAFFLQKYGMEYIESSTSKDEFLKLNDSYQSRLKIEKNFSNKGVIIDRVKLEIPSSSDNFYPLEFLLQGVEWPASVIPNKREEYLSDKDFESLFKISKDKFKLLDKFKQKELKVKYKLF